MSDHVFYLDAGGEACHAVYRPAAGSRDRSAIVLIPLFGWEDLASYRSLRAWAGYLSERGHPVLRFDLPGTGTARTARLTAGAGRRWCTAASVAAQWIRAASTAPTVTVIGIGLGGLLAHEVGANGDAEQIVLWSSAVKGPTLLRAIRAFSTLETARMIETGAPAPPPLPQGALAPGGFLLAPETVEAISRVDLSSRRFPTGARALVLDRDGVELDSSLPVALRDSGVDVTTARSVGFATMLVDPDQARAPTAVFDRVQAWLDEGLEGDGVRRSPTHVPGTTELRSESVIEHPLVISRPFGRLTGVLAGPIDGRTAPLTMVFLNAGAIRRIGPHRMWVDAARRWAARGMPSLRLDLQGIGDADGNGQVLADVARFHDRRFTDDVRAVLDDLESRGVGKRFLLLGLCSGGFWAFQTALEDDRVASAVMLNPRVLYWSEEIEIARDLRRTRLLRHPRTWKRLARGDVPRGRWLAFAAWLVTGPVRRLRRSATFEERLPVEARIADAFDHLRAQDRRARFVFCDGEPLRDELTRADLLSQQARWPNVIAAFIPGRDHTLRPIWMHAHADAALDDAIEQELAIAAQKPR